MSVQPHGGVANADDAPVLADWAVDMIAEMVRAGATQEEARALYDTATRAQNLEPTRRVTAFVNATTDLLAAGVSAQTLLGLGAPPIGAVATARDTVQDAASTWTTGDLAAFASTLIDAGAPLNALHRTCLVFDGPDAARQVLNDVGPQQYLRAVQLLHHGVDRTDLEWALANLPGHHTRLDADIKEVCSLDRRGPRRVALMLLLHCKVPAVGAMAAAEALPGGYEEAVRLLQQDGFTPAQALRAACVFALAPDAPAADRAEATIDAEAIKERARPSLRISPARGHAAREV